MPRYTTVLAEVTNAVTEVAYTGLPTSSEFTWAVHGLRSHDTLCPRQSRFCPRIFTKSAKPFNTFTTKMWSIWREISEDCVGHI